jgi:hypothetical protein
LIKIKKAVVVMNYLEHTWYLYSCSVPMRGSPAQGFRRLEAVSGRLPASIRVKETGRRSELGSVEQELGPPAETV